MGYLIRMKKQIFYRDYKENKLSIILATKAFGMGIDISDIQKVYHHAPSGHFSDYIQEIGRVARDKNITGFAEIDFHHKDLKFTKILYGLSSIKQYQIKLVMEKIRNMYNYRKKQNFLVSAEDFNYIFDTNYGDIDNKVKSALLLLEKDLIKKFTYNLIIVRPKSLYSVVYGEIPYSIVDDFKKKYGKVY